MDYFKKNKKSVDLYTKKDIYYRDRIKQVIWLYDLTINNKR